MTTVGVFFVTSQKNLVRVEWTKDSGGRWKMEEVPGSEKFFPAELVFLALGFLGPESDVVKALGVKQDARSNIQTPSKACDRVFSYYTYTEMFCRSILRTLKVSLRQEIVAADNHLSYGESSEYSQFGNSNVN